MAISVVHAKDIAKSKNVLESLRILALTNRCVYCNLHKTNLSFANHMSEDVYGSRAAFVSSIELLELPSNALLYGSLHFVVECNGSFLREQFPPYIGEGMTFATIEDIVAPMRSVVEVTSECIMVGRYGVSTWGHWLGELLPKILLAEKHMPHRFTYVLPIYAVDGQRPNSVWSSIHQSLKVCGIGEDQIIAVDPSYNYSFSKLFLISNIWSDHVIHPAAAALIRKSTDHIQASPIKRLAIKRNSIFGRQIENVDEIYSYLSSRDYKIVEAGLLTFADQIALFKGAKNIFSVLGSDLTNLLVSPLGVKVASVAPDNFGDRFFYALLLERQGWFSDLRGPIVSSAATHHKGSFQIDRNDLTTALDALEKAS